MIHTDQDVTQERITGQAVRKRYNQLVFRAALLGSGNGAWEMSAAIHSQKLYTHTRGLLAIEVKEKGPERLLM